MNKLKNVDYDTLDKAKNLFIEASRSTLSFAAKFGFVPNDSLGGSANIFCLDLKPFLNTGASEIFLTLLPEGLGTADDARPDDLSAAELQEFWSNIGTKMMSALTNDAAASGLQTILIGLYLPSSTPEIVFDENFMHGYLRGFTAGCKEVGCVYISGETPQLKDKIVEGKLDVAGALFALSPPGLKPVDSSNLDAGDRIVFVESSGPHENGFTVLRKLAGTLSSGYRTRLKSGQEFWRAINAPSKLYTPLVQAVLQANVQPTALENITGHGWQKIMRSKKSLRYVIEKTLPVPEVFQFVEEQSGSSVKEMLKIFNYGAGFAIFLRTAEQAEQVVEIAKKLNLNAVHAGYVENSERREVFVKPYDVVLGSDEFNLKRG